MRDRIGQPRLRVSRQLARQRVVTDVVQLGFFSRAEGISFENIVHRAKLRASCPIVLCKL